KQVRQMLPQLGARLSEETDADKVLEIERWSVEGEAGFSFEAATGYINGMGNARSAMETLFYLQRTSPKFAFIFGIAVTLDPSTANLGDVVIAKSVQWWNLNKVMKDSTKVAQEGDAKYLKLGDHYFRKAIWSVGDHEGTHWDKRLTRFIADQGQGQMLPA